MVLACGLHNFNPNATVLLVHSETLSMFDFLAKLKDGISHQKMKPKRSVMFVVLVWLGVTSAAMANETLRIGVSLGLTGGYAEPAEMQKMAYRLWEKEINEDGGILGRNVEIIIEDDKSRVERAQKIYRDLILKSKVDLVFGPYSSQITKAVAPIVNEQQYPMLAAGASADSIWQQGYKNVFGMWIPAVVILPACLN